MPSILQFAPVLTEADIASVASLAHDIWYEYYVPLIGRAQVDYMVARFQSASAIAQQIADSYEYFMVQCESRTLGYFAVEPRPAEGALFISKFYVVREVRGSGTGRACMEFIERLAWERRLGRLWLTVNKGNPAVNAYQRLGFRISEELVIDIGGGFVMDDFRMEKLLG